MNNNYISYQETLARLRKSYLDAKDQLLKTYQEAIAQAEKLYLEAER